MPRTTGAAAPRVADSRHAYKSFSRLDVAQSVALPSPSAGGHILPLHSTAIRILRALAPPSLMSSKLRSGLAPALSARELVARTGIKRRTVYYWLHRLLSLGCIERVGEKPASVYVITPLGARVLAFNLPRLHTAQASFALQTTMAGCSANLCHNSLSKKFAKTIRLLPLPPLALRWWVELDGAPNGFHELGLRLPARRFLRWLRSIGALEPRRRRVKRIVIYVKGKEVHVDVATSLTRDEVELLGPTAVWRELLFAHAAVSAACEAAGIDSRLLASMPLALRV